MKTSQVVRHKAVAHPVRTDEYFCSCVHNQRPHHSDVTSVQGSGFGQTEQSYDRVLIS